MRIEDKKMHYSSFNFAKVLVLLSAGKNELLIFGLAAGVRMLTVTAQTAYGVHSIPFLPGASAIYDFFSLTSADLQALSQGLIPYADFGFWYTPLFLYTLYPFYVIGGIEMAAVPILVADAATAVVIYCLVKSRTNRNLAIVVGMAYALSPLVVYEEGYLLLSSQPMVFVLLLSTYFLTTERPMMASFLLGLSALFKQQALFVLPVFIAWYLIKHKLIAWKAIVILVATIAVVSLPFLLIAPGAYLVDTSYGLIPLHAGSNLLGASLSHSANNSNTYFQTCSSFISQAQSESSFVACGITYSWTAPSAHDQISAMIAITSWAAEVVEVPILLLIAFMLYISRKRSDILTLSSAYSIVSGLVLFSYTVHGLFSYYFLPVYALLCASATTRNSSIILIAISATSILVPVEGSISSLLCLLGVAAILATKDARSLDKNSATNVQVPTSNTTSKISFS